MDGIHDLGGRHGFGRVDRADAGPLSKRWHGSVFAMLRALAGIASRNSDQFRHAVERIDPRAYLGHGYYGRWLGAVETLAVEAGLITSREVTTKVLKRGGSPRDLIAARPRALPVKLPELNPAPTAQRAMDTPPRFVVGEPVVTTPHGVAGHTRLPAYARGREGVIHAHHAGWVFPDTNAMGDGEQPQHLYTVRFAARELWGSGAAPNDVVHLDLFESYLQSR